MLVGQGAVKICHGFAILLDGAREFIEAAKAVYLFLVAEPCGFQGTP